MTIWSRELLDINSKQIKNTVLLEFLSILVILTLFTLFELTFKEPPKAQNLDQPQGGGRKNLEPPVCALTVPGVRIPKPCANRTVWNAVSG